MPAVITAKMPNCNTANPRCYREPTERILLRNISIGTGTP
jgi:hypothetical protein